MTLGQGLVFVRICINHVLCAALQGQFTSWLNTARVTRTVWFDPSRDHPANITSYIPAFRNGSYAINSQIHRAYVKQPEFSMLKNCTAAITDYSLKRYVWLVIPCDQTYDVTYICELSKPKIFRPINQHQNNTCDADWFNLGQAEDCLLIVWPDTALSFNDAAGICSAHNASLYFVDVAFDRRDTRASHEVKYNLLARLKKSDKYLADRVQQIESNILHTIISGKSLARGTQKKRLPQMIYFMLPVSSERTHLSFFVSLYNTCGILERSHTETGVKCRPCYEPINTTAVICEKPSKPYHNKCDTNHFACQDRTCVLSIYRCDFVVDCFDGSDENQCLQNITISPPDQIVTLLCSLGDSCVDKVPVHSICDGIYMPNVNQIYKFEKTVCLFSQIKQINLSRLIGNVQSAQLTYIFWSEIVETFKKEMNYNCNKNNTYLNNQFDVNSSKYKILSDYQFHRKDDCKNITVLCKIGVDLHDRYCKSSAVEAICKYVRCPGMFKCRSYYCIHMSSVCDGQFDCKHGEDEQQCAQLTCPGSLKCRAENRCVGKTQICDGRKDCQYSMDDEVDCYDCPEECHCRGYVVSCNLHDPMNSATFHRLTYVKGIILKYSEYDLYVDHLNMPFLIYLNTSHSSIKNINNKQLQLSDICTLLVVDFSYNKLMQINFLNYSIFTKIVYFDVSHNLLYALVFEKTLSQLPKFLSVFIVLGNNLKYVSMRSGKQIGSLSFIDMRHINYHPQLSIFISEKLYDGLQIKLSDYHICCILPANMECLPPNESIFSCFGLIQSQLEKYLMYFLSSTAFALSVFIIVINAMIKIISKKKIMKNRNHSIVVVNQSLSTIICSVYLVGISISDILKVNALIFRKGNLCILFNALLYTTLECTLIFKALLICIISLKMAFPFSHQCSWLKWTWLVSSCTWVFIIVTYLIMMFAFQISQNTLFDNLCSVAWCGQRTAFNLLFIMSLVDFGLILIIIFSMAMAYSSLRVISETTTSLSHKPYSISSVMFKIASPIFPEIVFVFFLLSVIINKLSNSISENYCIKFFILALPLNIISSCLISLAKIIAILLKY